jgi:hypothetical protein
MNYSYQGRHPPAKLAALASGNNSMPNSSAPNQLGTWQNQSNSNWQSQAQPHPSLNCPYQPPVAWHHHQPQSTTTWVLDNDATDHFTPNLNTLNHPMEYQGSDQVSLGNGAGLPITHFGHSQLRASSHLFNLRKVLKVPSMKSNLLSVNKFCRNNNCSFKFDASKFSSKDGLYPILGHIPHNSHHTYSPSLNFSSSPHYNSTAFLGTKGTKSIWHSCLGHPQDCVLHFVLNKQPWLCVNNAKFSSDCCKHCVQGKLHQLPFSSSSFTASTPLELVHSNV